MAAPSPELHPEALLEAEAGLLWYSSRSAIAGERFLGALDRAIARICDAPERWPRYVAGTRRYVLLRFPYVIVYKPTREKIVIYAVAHAKRRPGYWRNRLNWQVSPNE